MPKKKTFSFSEKWNLRFMALAKLVAQWSKDESTKVGCVIIGPDKEVRSMGYNGFPRGVDDNVPERKIRPQKYDFTEHAERNAIYNAGLYGASLKNCVLYVTFPPCVDCARGIIQSGIREVIYMDLPQDNTQKIAGWRDKLGVSFDMFDEAGVIYKSLNTSGNDKEHADFLDTLNLFNGPQIDQFAKYMVAKNGKEYQSFICVEEINELIKELVLNNSFDNTAEETADYIITRNHVVCAYDLGKDVKAAELKKIATPEFMQESYSEIVALLDFQKSLIKYVNRGATTLDDLVNRIADADIAVVKQIIKSNSLEKIQKTIQEKIKRTKSR